MPARAAAVPYAPASASDPVPRACVCGLGSPGGRIKAGSGHGTALDPALGCGGQLFL